MILYLDRREVPDLEELPAEVIALPHSCRSHWNYSPMPCTDSSRCHCVPSPSPRFR